MYHNVLKMALVGLGVALIAIPSASLGQSKDAVGCQRTLAKETQKYFQKKLNDLRKCNDGLLKEGLDAAGCPASDPKGKAAAKIAKSVDKAKAKIIKKCADAAAEGNGWASDGTDNIGFYDNCPRANCAAVIDSETALADCAVCVVDDLIDNIMDDSRGVYGALGDTSTDKGVLKCQRTFGKELAQLARKNSKFQLKCEDGLIKGGTTGICPGDDPKGKASGKISGFITKADGKIEKKCPDMATEDAAVDQGTVASSFGSVDDAAEVVSAAAQSVISFAVAKDACGDSIIAASETCDDGNFFEEDGVGTLDTCPRDCFIGPCSVGGTQQVTVNFSSPVDLIGLTIVLNYDDTVVELPGEGGNPAVQAALSSSSFTITPGDANYALRAVLNDPFLFGVSSGEAFVADFNDCSGPVTVGDFECSVVDAVDNTFATRDDVTCSVTVP